MTGIYTAPQPPPPKSKVIKNTPPNPGGTHPQTKPKKFGDPEVHKKTKVLEVGREKW